MIIPQRKQKAKKFEKLNFVILNFFLLLLKFRV